FGKVHRPERSSLALDPEGYQRTTRRGFSCVPLQRDEGRGRRRAWPRRNIFDVLILERGMPGSRRRYKTSATLFRKGAGLRKSPGSLFRRTRAQWRTIGKFSASFHASRFDQRSALSQSQIG